MLASPMASSTAGTLTAAQPRSADTIAGTPLSSPVPAPPTTNAAVGTAAPDQTEAEARLVLLMDELEQLASIVHPARLRTAADRLHALASAQARTWRALLLENASTASSQDNSPGPVEQLSFSNVPMTDEEARSVDGSVGSVDGDSERGDAVQESPLPQHDGIGPLDFDDERKRGDKNGASRTTTSGSLVVFTVSTGGYDVETGSEPRLAKRAMPGVEFLRFVDETSLAKLAGRSSRWQTILLNASDAPGGGGTGAAQRLSRDIKLRPHRYPAIWRHSASIYVDSNVRIHQPLWPIFAKVANGSADLAAYDFGRGLDNEAAWVRRYLIAKSPTFQSAAAQARLNRTLEWQVARYKQHGDHNWNRTMYGKVILRRHTSCARRFGELWWHEYNIGVPRDQLSFRHCIREAGRRCGLEHVSLGWNGRHGPKFYRYFLVHFSQQKGRLAGFR